jgi:DnaJ-class molecular chaperone
MAMIEPAECFRCKRTRPHRYGCDVCIDCEAERDKREEGGARVCPTCGGKGRQDLPLPGADIYIDMVAIQCPDCDGTGEVKDV